LTAPVWHTYCNRIGVYKVLKRGRKEMKVNKNFKLVVIASMLTLAISACGKGTYTSSNNAASLIGSGTCGTAAAAGTVYSGDIVTCEEAGYCDPYAYVVTGSISLAVYASGMSSQATISAALTLNGSTYCCSSQGLATLGYPQAYMSADVNATISSLSLICQPTSAGTGGYFGGYQSMSIRVGVPTGEFTSAWLTKDQRVIGFIEIVSAIQGIGNSTQFVQ